LPSEEEGPADRVVITPADVVLGVGSTLQFKAVTVNARGEPAPGYSLSWSSSNSAVAEVSETGFVSALTIGTVTITVTAGKGKKVGFGNAPGQIKKSALLTVDTTQVAEVRVEPATFRIPVGAKGQLVATVKDARNNVLQRRHVTWSSSDTSIVRIDETGFATAVARGSAIASAVSEQKVGTAAIEVGVRQLLFSTSWERGGLGASDAAVLDNGYLDFRHGDERALEVINSSVEDTPGGYNALKVTQRGENVADMVGKTNAWDPEYDGRYDTPRDVAHRYYFKNRDTSEANDHHYQSHPFMYGETWAVSKIGSTNGWRLILRWAVDLNYMRNGITGIWEPTFTLSNDNWYRIELLFKYNSRNEFRGWVRIYDLNGTLLHDSYDFVSNTGSGIVMGNWYDQGNWMHLDDSSQETFFGTGDYGVMNYIDLGNNGQAGAANTGLPWFFSNLVIIDATTIVPNDPVWIGPS
jgi:hypothetical protein